MCLAYVAAPRDGGNYHKEVQRSTKEEHTSSPTGSNDHIPIDHHTYAI